MIFFFFFISYFDGIEFYTLMCITCRQDSQVYQDFQTCVALDTPTIWDCFRNIGSQMLQCINVKAYFVLKSSPLGVPPTTKIDLNSVKLYSSCLTCSTRVEVRRPVLKINNHATGGWRTKDILGGPKGWGPKKKVANVEIFVIFEVFAL